MILIIYYSIWFRRHIQPICNFGLELKVALSSMTVQAAGHIVGTAGRIYFRHQGLWLQSNQQCHWGLTFSLEVLALKLEMVLVFWNPQPFGGVFQVSVAPWVQQCEQMVKGMSRVFYNPAGFAVAAGPVGIFQGGGGSPMVFFFLCGLATTLC